MSSIYGNRYNNNSYNSRNRGGSSNNAAPSFRNYARPHRLPEDGGIGTPQSGYSTNPTGNTRSNSQLQVPCSSRYGRGSRGSYQGGPSSTSYRTKTTGDEDRVRNEEEGSSFGYTATESAYARLTAEEIEKLKRRKLWASQGNYGAAYYPTMSMDQLRLANPYVDVNDANQELEEKKTKTPLDFAKGFDKKNDITNFGADFKRWLNLTHNVHMEFSYRAIRDANRDPENHCLFVFVEYVAPKFKSEYHSKMLYDNRSSSWKGPVRTDASSEGGIIKPEATSISDKDVKERFRVKGSKIASDRNILELLKKTGRENDAEKVVAEMETIRGTAKAVGKCAGFLFLVCMVNGKYDTHMCQFYLGAVPPPLGDKYSETNTETETVGASTKLTDHHFEDSGSERTTRAAGSDAGESLAGSTISMPTVDDILASPASLRAYRKDIGLAKDKKAIKSELEDGNGSTTTTAATGEEEEYKFVAPTGRSKTKNIKKELPTHDTVAAPSSGASKHHQGGAQSAEFDADDEDDSQSIITESEGGEYAGNVSLHVSSSHRSSSHRYLLSNPSTRGEGNGGYGDIDEHQYYSDEGEEEYEQQEDKGNGNPSADDSHPSSDKKQPFNFHYNYKY